MCLFLCITQFNGLRRPSHKRRLISKYSGTFFFQRKTIISNWFATLLIKNKDKTVFLRNFMYHPTLNRENFSSQAMTMRRCLSKLSWAKFMGQPRVESCPLFPAAEACFLHIGKRQHKQSLQLLLNLIFFPPAGKLLARSSGSFALNWVVVCINSALQEKNGWHQGVRWLLLSTTILVQRFFQSARAQISLIQHPLKSCESSRLFLKQKSQWEKVHPIGCHIVVIPTMTHFP